MIVGSGLIARAFSRHASQMGDSCIYAAGVSNSGCTDASEFARDEDRLRAAMATLAPSTQLLYFSTCSVGDPSLAGSQYVVHKRKLEEIVRARSPHLVIRLPQVAGVTPNPHTLLNHLYARISRSERFDLWRNARRNIIDVEDAASIIAYLVAREKAVDETIDVACPHSAAMHDIVKALEAVTERRAIYREVDRGAAYEIDTARIARAVQGAGVRFGADYLARTVRKYYTKHVGA